MKISSIDARLLYQESYRDRKTASHLREETRKWFSPYDPQHNYQKSLDRFNPGTGTSFLETTLKDWVVAESQARITVVRGRPGIGKTTLL